MLGKQKYPNYFQINTITLDPTPSHWGTVASESGKFKIRSGHFSPGIFLFLLLLVIETEFPTMSLISKIRLTETKSMTSAFGKSVTNYLILEKIIYQ